MAVRTLGSWARTTLEAWMCPRLSVLCCPLYVEALLWLDPPFKESYLCLKGFYSTRLKEVIKTRCTDRLEMSGQWKVKRGWQLAIFVGHMEKTINPDTLVHVLEIGHLEDEEWDDRMTLRLTRLTEVWRFVVMVWHIVWIFSDFIHRLGVIKTTTCLHDQLRLF
jgi:hypothetical protein